MILPGLLANYYLRRYRQEHLQAAFRISLAGSGAASGGAELPPGHVMMERKPE
jgi:hypothetical protein